VITGVTSYPGEGDKGTEERSCTIDIIKEKKILHVFICRYKGSETYPVGCIWFK